MTMSRLLLVDDDFDTLQAMGDLLSFHLKDVEVDRASSGPDALELLSRSCTYDAVITDIKMPIMDGLTLMAKICERRPNLPTLLLTGHGDRDIGVKALKSGAYAYMPKPVDRDYFLAWVQRAIHLSQLNRQIQEQIALERQRSQELAQVVLALRDSERRFRLLVEVSFEAVAVSGHGRIIEVNSNFSKMFGYDDLELKTMRVTDFHPPEARDLVECMNLSEQTLYEAICLRKDGSRFAAEIHGRAMPYVGRHLRVTAIRDISLSPAAVNSSR